MNLEACTDAIRSKVGADSGLAATLKFDMGADGVIVIDGKSTPNTVSNTNTDTDCTVGITLDNLNAMLSGDLEPATGFMAGKLKVSGDMSVAMRLQRVI
ncbi:SCP2 sterol-binding domain-containing protein [Rhodoferax aquaticus]|jgi:putative sterol carrier protein|uniref:Sterol-binding protein n=1 Tax=Rhodoferax aquaticus TaxID=2527691 RepID=A0A515ELN3_9BURK|nr:SCP2 sterol-binding domain-containing protein [Rhodoferax aquaticus]QDL53575.1 sterol-binding protein [Rhodoferax aquaticus]